MQIRLLFNYHTLKMRYTCLGLYICGWMDITRAGPCPVSCVKACVIFSGPSRCCQSAFFVEPGMSQAYAGVLHSFFILVIRLSVKMIKQTKVFI